MKQLRKVLALLLALCVAAALSPAAFAVNLVHAENETKTFDGDVTGAEYELVKAYADDGQTASMTVNGSVTDNATDSKAFAVNAEAIDDGSTATATVNGDVSATGNQTAEGVYAYTGNDATGNGGSAAITVNGDVSASTTDSTASYDVYGVEAYSTPGSVDVAVTGSVAANGANGAQYVYGLSLEAEDIESGDAAATAAVGGDVTATGGHYAYGVDAWSYGDSGSKGDASFTVGGSVNAEGGTYSTYGLYVGGGGDARVNGAVAGDVSGVSAQGEGYGLYLDAYEDGGNVCDLDLLIEGTLSGSTAAIYLEDDNENDHCTLTVWRIVLNGGGRAALCDDDMGAQLRRVGATLSEDFEQNILYIIKVDDAVKDGVVLAGTTQSHGFDCAKEDEVVSVSGANVGSLVCDGAALQQDGDGNYFLIVPKGGGVYLRLPVKAVATNEVPVIVTLDAGSHIGLRLLKDGSYVLRLADGTKFYGRYELVDGLPVFTLADGSTVTPELGENGRYTFTLPYGEGQSATFSMSAAKLALLVDAAA